MSTPTYTANASAVGSAYVTVVTPPSLVTSNSSASASSTVSYTDALQKALYTAQNIANNVAKNEANIITQAVLLSKGNILGTGFTGPPGPQGYQGVAGAQGSTGSQGDAGTATNTGATGVPGSQGSQGYTGSQGPQGAPGGGSGAGSTGAQGPTGSKGVSGSTGPQGPQGAPGGGSGAGSTGAQGPTGSQGAQGAPGGGTGAGSTGAQGSQGETGSIGPTGPAGSGTSSITQVIVYCYYTIGSTSTAITTPGIATLSSITTTNLPPNLNISVLPNNVLQFTNSVINSTSSFVKKAQLIPSSASGLALGSTSNLTASTPFYSYNNSILISSTKFTTPSYGGSSTIFNLSLPYVSNQLFVTASSYTGLVADISVPVILGILNLTFDSNAFI
jgi:hypothetical protein